MQLYTSSSNSRVLRPCQILRQRMLNTRNIHTQLHPNQRRVQVRTPLRSPRRRRQPRPFPRNSTHLSRNRSAGHTHQHTLVTLLTLRHLLINPPFLLFIRSISAHSRPQRRHRQAQLAVRPQLHPDGTTHIRRTAHPPKVTTLRQIHRHIALGPRHLLTNTTPLRLTSNRVAAAVACREVQRIQTRHSLAATDLGLLGIHLLPKRAAIRLLLPRMERPCTHRHPIHRRPLLPIRIPITGTRSSSTTDLMHLPHHLTSTRSLRTPRRPRPVRRPLQACRQRLDIHTLARWWDLCRRMHAASTMSIGSPVYSSSSRTCRSGPRGRSD